MRTSWGNNGRAVAPEQIKELRAGLALVSTAPAKFTTARFADMVSTPNADELVYGMRLMTETKALEPDHVGSELNCGACHPNGGTVASASPFNGLASVFPADSPRSGRAISLEERINGCFLRSMNGTRLLEDSKEMKAMIAFMAFMKGDRAESGGIVGRGTDPVDNRLVPDPVRGKALFEFELRRLPRI